MYWRGMPHFDPEEFAVVDLIKKPASDDRVSAALLDLVKYLAITAVITVALAMSLSVLARMLAT